MIKPINLNNRLHNFLNEDSGFEFRNQIYYDLEECIDIEILHQIDDKFNTYGNQCVNFYYDLRFKLFNDLKLDRF